MSVRCRKGVKASKFHERQYDRKRQIEQQTILAENAELAPKPYFVAWLDLAGSQPHKCKVGDLVQVCEGYSGIRIRTDDSYIRNVASGGAPYILCGYMQLRTLVN